MKGKCCSWCCQRYVGAFTEINAPVGAGLRPAGLFSCSAMKPHHPWLGEQPRFEALGFCLHSS